MVNGISSQTKEKNIFYSRKELINLLSLTLRIVKEDEAFADRDVIRSRQAER